MVYQVSVIRSSGIGPQLRVFRELTQLVLSTTTKLEETVAVVLYCISKSLVNVVVILATE